MSRAARLDLVFTALADPDRRRAVELLGQQPRSAGELAGALGLAAPAMSRHLRLLKQAGLAEETHPEFDARVRIYSLKEGAMADLKHWLADTETMWADQLAAFKAHAENRRK
ncbi:ArsR/SmtB family transcription factor [Hyphomonas sp.]|uniref:ArsR/SmtB family transcription factor n=1 Tax=Hyphomonas sp. TaxID=87 RepID=UPI00391C4EC8